LSEKIISGAQTPSWDAMLLWKAYYWTYEDAVPRAQLSFLFHFISSFWKFV